MGFSNYTEQNILDHTLRQISFAAPERVYLALFEDTAGLEENSTGVQTEVNTGGYTRSELTGILDRVDTQTVRNNAEVIFPTATANWRSVKAFAIMDAATNGNVLYYGVFPTEYVIRTGGSFRILPNDLIITLE